MAAENLTKENIEILSTVQDWHYNAYSINTLAYTNRIKLLMDTFGEVCTTELLDAKFYEKSIVPHHLQQQQQNGGGSNNTNVPA
jgi:hypothetical protein